jgi:hypothetical protein
MILKVLGPALLLFSTGFAAAYWKRGREEGNTASPLIVYEIVCAFLCGIGILVRSYL